MFWNTKANRERRRQERKAFQQYMQFKNDRTGELVGDLADISHGGFRLEGTQRVPVNAELSFRVDMPPETPGRASIVFIAKSRWILPHPIDPRMYVSGFEIKRMDPGDGRSFRHLCDHYGSSSGAKSKSNDYVWQD